MDEIDLKIVELLQQNSRISNAEIARRVNMAPSAVLERIKKLEEKKIIREYVARISPKAVNRGLLAFISVQAERCGCELGEALAEVPGVLEVHNVAGVDCYLVKVRASDTDGLAKMLNDEFRMIPGLRSTKTTIVLTTVKETTSLPLGGSEDDN